MRLFLGCVLFTLIFVVTLLGLPLQTMAQVAQRSLSVIPTPVTQRTLSPQRRQVLAANQQRTAAVTARQRQSSVQSRAASQRNRFMSNAAAQRQSVLRAATRMTDAAVRSATRKQDAARAAAQRKVASVRAAAQRKNNAYLIAAQRQGAVARAAAQRSSLDSLRAQSSTSPVSQTQKITEDQKISIILPETSFVEGEQYKLGDIAELKGTDFALIDQLSQLLMGRSPIPGAKTSITKARILSKLRSGNINPAFVIFPNGSSTQIQRSALRIPGKDIDQVVLDHIKEQNPDTEIKPRILSNSRDVFLPKGEVDFKVSERGQYKKEGGYRTYSVNFQVDGKNIKTVAVRTYLKIYKDVYVAKETIKRNQVVQEKDVRRTRKNIDTAPSAYLTKKSDLVGKIAKRTINSKEILQKGALTTAPAILSGDRLMIIYETKSLLISVPGVSLSKGRVGEVIPVRNLQSKTVVYATVKGKNKVQVK